MTDPDLENDRELCKGQSLIMDHEIQIDMLFTYCESGIPELYKPPVPPEVNMDPKWDFKVWNYELNLITLSNYNMANKFWNTVLLFIGPFLGSSVEMFFLKLLWKSKYINTAGANGFFNNHVRQIAE